MLFLDAGDIDQLNCMVGCPGHVRTTTGTLCPGNLFFIV